MCGRTVIAIASLADLQAINEQLAGYCQLIADIDASETRNWSSGKGFAPIGSISQPFVGVLDGNGHAIRNLYINRGEESNVGLFGRLSSSGKLCNLKLEDTFVLGKDLVGSLVGFSEGYIAECQVSCEVSGSTMVGGLTGGNFRNINKCRVSGKVAGKTQVGGLVGCLYFEGKIIESEAVSDVSGNESVGGLVGLSNGKTTKCQASGKVSGNEDIGGLIGACSGDNSIAIVKCRESHASSQVSGILNVGGLVGFNREGGIFECRASGEVAGHENVGGLVGYNIGGEILDSKASGGVSGNKSVSALVGVNTEGGSTTGCHASGNVSKGRSFVGVEGGGIPWNFIRKASSDNRTFFCEHQESLAAVFARNIRKGSDPVVMLVALEQEKWCALLSLLYKQPDKMLFTPESITGGEPTFSNNGHCDIYVPPKLNGQGMQTGVFGVERDWLISELFWVKGIPSMFIQLINKEHEPSGTFSVVVFAAGGMLVEHLTLREE